MKELSLEQLENVNGGTCVDGVVNALATGGVMALVSGGWFGVGCLAALGCAAGILNE